jgi:hypothetical protein
MKRKRHGNIVSVTELNQNSGFGRTLHGTMVWLLLISIFGLSSGSVRPVYRLLVLPSDKVPPKHLNVSDFETYNLPGTRMPKQLMEKYTRVPKQIIETK